MARASYPVTGMGLVFLRVRLRPSAVPAATAVEYSCVVGIIPGGAGPDGDDGGTADADVCLLVDVAGRVGPRLQRLGRSQERPDGASAHTDGPPLVEAGTTLAGFDGGNR